MRRLERCAIDEGWVGKGVNWGTLMRPERPDPPRIEDREDRLLLYILDGGVWYRVWYKERPGFIR